MILKHKNRPLKLIPIKYAFIKNITDFLEDEDQRRLTTAERAHLDKALYLHHFNNLINSLQSNDQKTYEKVKNASPVYAVKVKPHGQSTTYTIRTNNNITLKCSKLLYELCPDKRMNAKQLTLFDQ
ncbi:MAG: hypothetical protein A2066_12980 [Bacteroidetes bacterium GWB2_41_8]|nr:MAG: hypothetical protein A2066_12980 [Bacteroidetes bacterium GWB2_41_8]